MSKYHLTEIIQSLNKEEIRNFKLFSARLQSGNERNKTVVLFDSIKTENLDEFSEEITLRFFSDNNKNAYYRLKNRLLADIEQSLLLLHHDKDEKYIIYNLIEIANIFKYKSKYELAHRYLLKAEKEAQHSDYADLLDVVYGEIIALANDYYKINPEIYIQKRQKKPRKPNGNPAGAIPDCYLELSPQKYQLCFS
ncbi:MAG: hypothetical protein IPL35_12215 [Sphingobacteriales bacterium]|nr:hypothetical protein [Sphingobacteriales bacterium]